MSVQIQNMIDEIEERMTDLYNSTRRMTNATDEQKEIFSKMYEEREKLYELQEELETYLNGKSVLNHLKKRELGKGRAKHYSSLRMYGKKGGNATEWVNSIHIPNAPYGKDLWGNPKNSMGWSPYNHFTGSGLPNLDQYIGESGEIVQKIFKKKYPYLRIVLLTPGMMMTADHRMDRLKISVDKNGMVQRITQG